VVMDLGVSARHDEVVLVDHDYVFASTEGGAELLTLLAGAARHLERREPSQTTGDVLTVGPDDPDRVALTEVSPKPDDADGKQAAVTPEQRLGRSGVNQQGAAGTQRVEDPVLARAQGLPDRRKAGADVFAAQDFPEDARFARIGDDHEGSRATRLVSRVEFAGDAASTDPI